MINKDKFIKTYISMYFIVIMAINYTAMHSPYMANHFDISIILLSLLIWATSFYLIGFKKIKIWFKDSMKAAKKRSELRKKINDELKKRL
jgi:hypothetical protein